MTDFISFSVPGIPPSVNHYVKHTRLGRHYVSQEAKQFWQLVGLHAPRTELRAKEYGVKIVVYLGTKQKGDVDNFAKVVLDSLKKCGVIDSDAKVKTLHLFKERDRTNPRTEVCVWAIDLKKAIAQMRRRVAQVGASTSERHQPEAEEK